MNRAEKQTLIDDLHQEFGRSPHAILVDFRGLSVPAVTEFRRKVRQAGSRYRVVKNTLALRAVKGTPLEKLGPKFDNTTGVAYTGTDPVALAKVLIDFAKDHPALVVKGGLVSGSADARRRGGESPLDHAQPARAARQAARPLQAPATQLVRLLNTPASQLARVLKAHQEKEEEK